MHSKQASCKKYKIKASSQYTPILVLMERANYFSPVLFRMASAVPVGISLLCIGIISILFPFFHF